MIQTRLWRDIPLKASDLRALGDDVLENYLKQLSPDQLDEILHCFEFWARPDQMEPEETKEGWMNWIFSAGRGAGKTYAGAQWVRHRVKSGDKRIHCIASTNGDIRKVMVEGDSGLLNQCWSKDKTYKGVHMGVPVWSPTNNSLTWANGAVALFFSAEDPNRLRGPQCYSCWCDETAAWRNQQETWDMMMFGLRLGRNPKVLVTSTPKPTKLMRMLLKHPKSFITRGSTFDNEDNLAPTFLEAVKATYEGTSLGRQELYAEMLEEAEGALWTTQVIDDCIIQREDLPPLEDFARIIVSVDPAVTANEESDMTGIVVAGIDVNGIGYVLQDATDRYSPQAWASKAIELYRLYGADRIVAERNQGGDMVRNTIHVEDETVPVRMVHASRGKFARAEPVSALYERKLVRHVPGLDELETQMRTWEPLGSIGSPDRLDAMVWAITDLMLNGVARPELNIVYSPAKGISKS